MSFEEIKGNDNVKQALVRMVDTGRVPHAILFHENDGGGGVPLCLAFLEYLMKSPKVGKMVHPDVHFVFPLIREANMVNCLPIFRTVVSGNPAFTENELNAAFGFENKSAIINVDDASGIISRLSFNSLEGGYSAVVMYLPEKMTAEASNKLLKSIEEPSGRTVFLLVSHSPEKVIPTIVSRCQNIRLIPQSLHREQTDEYSTQSLELFGDLMKALMSRDLKSALEVGEQLSALKPRERQKSFCRTASEELRKAFMLNQGMEGIAYVGSGDADLVRAISSLPSGNTFPRKALAVMDRAVYLIDRNVNQKIIFSDMVNRLYLCL